MLVSWMCIFIKMYGITNLQSVHFTVHIFSCNKIESNAGRIQIKSSNITYSIYPVPQLDNPKQAARAACLALPWQLVSFLWHTSCQQQAREPWTPATPASPAALFGKVGDAPAGHRKSSQLGLKGNRFNFGPDWSTNQFRDVPSLIWDF